MQNKGYEIDVFQSNYKRGVRPGTVLNVGNKQLKFVKVIKKIDSMSYPTSVGNKSFYQYLKNTEKGDNKSPSQ